MSPLRIPEAGADLPSGPSAIYGSPPAPAPLSVLELMKQRNTQSKFVQRTKCVAVLGGGWLVVGVSVGRTKCAAALGGGWLVG